MSRTHLSLTPQFRQLGKEILQTVSTRTRTQIARLKRRQRGLTIADFVKEIERIE